MTHYIIIGSDYECSRILGVRPDEQSARDFLAEAIHERFCDQPLFECQIWNQRGHIGGFEVGKPVVMFNEPNRPWRGEMIEL